jgi:hypothetical protein
MNYKRLSDFSDITLSQPNQFPISFIIVHRDDHSLFWAGDIGWSEFENAIHYPHKDMFPAPLGGVWSTYVEPTEYEE